MADFQGDALALSYWLTRSLPLEAACRQALLADVSAAARLRRAVSLLAQRAPLRCVTCSAQIAKQADVVEVSDEGAGGIYVNSHGAALQPARQGARRILCAYSWFRRVTLMQDGVLDACNCGLLSTMCLLHISVKLFLRSRCLVHIIMNPN